MSKRVAIIITGGIAGGNFGQGVPALGGLLTGLSKRHEITVYSLLDVPANPGAVPFELKTLPKTAPKGTFRRVVLLMKIIMRDHRRQAFELFHGFWGIPCGSMAVFLGYLYKKPSIVSLQGGETADLPSVGYGVLADPLKKRWLLATLKRADRITALSRFQENILRENGFSKEVHVVPYGVDKEVFCPKGKTYDKPYQLVHVANLNKVKNQEALLRVFRAINEHVPVHLQIIGDGYMEERLRQCCLELDIADKVEFVGPVPNLQLRDYLAKSHLMLHTSLYEAQAVSVVEAMACKVPVAGTRVGILSDLKAMAITVPVGDLEELAKKVVGAFTEPGKSTLARNAEMAYQWACAHDMESSVSDFSELYG